MALKVCETFYSLMGESTRAGLPAWFIRLSGCNLRCRYCDTTYAYEGGRMGGGAGGPGPGFAPPAGAGDRRRAVAPRGDPALLSDLLDAGFTVCLETNGSLPIDGVDGRVHRILDLKCPGSGMAGDNDGKPGILTPG